MDASRTPSNAAILPGSVFPYRGVYQQLAESLPTGAILVVLPETETPQRVALEILALHLQGAGHRVTTLVDDAGKHGGALQSQLALPAG